MRTTIDIPDQLFRQVKAEAALRGKKLKDLIEEGLRLALKEGSAESKPAGKKPSFHDLAKDLIDYDAEGPTDLSTNPKYLEGFGR
jgi:hypothetical protein